MPVPGLRSSAARTALLSAGLAVLAAAVSAAWIGHVGAGALVDRPVLAALLAVAFFLAEQHLVTFEFRRQSHSMTFAGVPLALGVLLLPVPALVAARVLGSACAMAMQRTRGEKLAYNLSAFAVEAAVTGSLGTLLVRRPRPAVRAHPHRVHRGGRPGDDGAGAVRHPHARHADEPARGRGRWRPSRSS